MKYVYITVDLEEWYHLDYLKGFDLAGTGVETIPLILDFLDMLDRHGIKATFFVLGEVALRNADILREIVGHGHEIGCHGLDHGLLWEKGGEQFLAELNQARRVIGEAAGCDVNGYRASCFSLERDKLELVRAAGFGYDSSKIAFRQHPLYRSLNLTGFARADDLVYRDGAFYEYEIPTLDIGNYSLPLSGGGYLRLFPLPLIKALLRRYERAHENFLIYAHPFELTDIPLPLPKGLGILTRFRCMVGRRRNLRKLEKLLRYLAARRAVFRTLGQDRGERLRARGGAV